MRRSGARSVTGKRGIFQEFELYGVCCVSSNNVGRLPDYGLQGALKRGLA